MIFADALPKIKAFLQPAPLTASTLGLLVPPPRPPPRRLPRPLRTHVLLPGRRRLPLPETAPRPTGPLPGPPPLVPGLVRPPRRRQLAPGAGEPPRRHLDLYPRSDLRRPARPTDREHLQPGQLPPPPQDESTPPEEGGQT